MGPIHRPRIALWVGPLLALLALAPARAQQGPIIAVFQMEDRGSGIDSQGLANLTDLLAALLTEGGFQVIPPDQVRARLTDQKQDSYKSCFDQGCQIEIGRELAAQKTLATRILKIGDSCQVSAVLYDLKKAATETAANAEAKCDEKELLQAVRQIAGKLSQAVASKPAPVPEPPKLPSEPMPEPKPEPAAGPTPAHEKLLHPLLLENLRQKSEVGLGAILFVYKNTMFIPKAHGVYAIGDFAIGAWTYLSLYRWADQAEGALVLSYRTCSQGGWSFCFGGGINAGAKYENKHPDSSTTLEYTSIPVTPKLDLALGNGGFFFQAEVGVPLEYFASHPPSDTFVPSGDLEVSILYGAGAGYRFLPWLEMLAEFTGSTPLNNDADSSVFNMYGSLRLRFGGWQPFGALRIKEKKDKEGNEVWMLGLVGGLAYEF